MLHGIEGNQCACTTESCFAMHSNSTGIWFSEVFLTGIEELINNVLGRSRAVHEYHVLVVNAFVDETLMIVLGIVKSDHFAYF